MRQSPAPDALPDGTVEDQGRSRLPAPAVRLGRAPATAAHALIRAYQVTLSGLAGRGCRYLPSCSDYADEAIQCFGLWAGGWMGLARICRCHPFGGAGLDFVPPALPQESAWYRPWRYGRWRGTLSALPVCEAVEPGDGTAPR
jgi:putative membrane protein insertion efficiency factor